MPAARAYALTFIGCVAVAFGSACATPMLVKTDAPGARLVVDDQDLGEVPPEGVTVDVGIGIAPVPYTVTTKEGEVHTGAIPRTGFSWWSVITGIGCATVLSPTCAAVSYVVANPALWVAPAFCLSLSLSGFAVVLSAPSVTTLPCVVAGASSGLLPLGLLCISEQPPRAVVVHVPKAAAGAPPIPDATPAPDVTPAPDEVPAPDEQPTSDHRGGEEAMWF